jgi:hypothetical protein
MPYVALAGMLYYAFISGIPQCTYTAEIWHGDSQANSSRHKFRSVTRDPPVTLTLHWQKKNQNLVYEPRGSNKHHASVLSQLLCWKLWQTSCICPVATVVLEALTNIMHLSCRNCCVGSSHKHHASVLSQLLCWKLSRTSCICPVATVVLEALTNIMHLSCRNCCVGNTLYFTPIRLRLQ